MATVYSQNTEQNILQFLFKDLVTRCVKLRMECVEFGAGDGYNLSNTRYFIEQGWKGHQWDKMPKKECVLKEFITAENVNIVFAKHQVHMDFDLLSIDVDGNDYWIWKALNWYPKIVVIEFNPSFNYSESKTIEYNPNFVHNKTSYFGASFCALLKLGHTKGYELINYTGNNLIFVRREIVTGIMMAHMIDRGLKYRITRGWPKHSPDKIWKEV